MIYNFRKYVRLPLGVSVNSLITVHESEHINYINTIIEVFFFSTPVYSRIIVNIVWTLKHTHKNSRQLALYYVRTRQHSLGRQNHWKKLVF